MNPGEMMIPALELLQKNLMFAVGWNAKRGLQSIGLTVGLRAVVKCLTDYRGGKLPAKQLFNLTNEAWVAGNKEYDLWYWEIVEADMIRKQVRMSEEEVAS